MTLTFGLSSSRDLFDKLKRDAVTLNEEVTTDHLFNFVVTGYSLIDWVKNDPSVPASASASAAIQGLRSDKWLKICGDLANSVKHFTLTTRTPITASATSSQGYGVGRFGKGGYGVGEESIELALNDGSTYDSLEFVQNVLDTWETFFNTHNM